MFLGVKSGSVVYGRGLGKAVLSSIHGIRPRLGGAFIGRSSTALFQKKNYGRVVGLLASVPPRLLDSSFKDSLGARRLLSVMLSSRRLSDSHCVL